jgi:N-methylhydantoinase A/oxoprolinase/acetone carboxylase beta subunit
VSVAVVLKHAAIYPRHEQLVGELARELGFKQVGHAVGFAMVPAATLGRL